MRSRAERRAIARAGERRLRRHIFRRLDGATMPPVYTGFWILDRAHGRCELWLDHYARDNEIIAMMRVGAFAVSEEMDEGDIARRCIRSERELGAEQIELKLRKG